MSFHYQKRRDLLDFFHDNDNGNDDDYDSDNADDDDDDDDDDNYGDDDTCRHRQGLAQRLLLCPVLTDD